VQRYAAGVVTTIFKSLESNEQNRNDIALRHGADDATHACISTETPNGIGDEIVESVK
jgi:hypothetical protein